MLEILFGSPKEAKLIYSIFRTLCKSCETELQIVNQKCIKLSPDLWEVSLEKLVIPGLVKFMIDYKEHQIMAAIIKEHYFFLEEEEQQQIIHIAYSIMEGERTDIPKVQHLKPREGILKEAFQDFLRPGLFFSFCSFQKFRLHHYMSSLREYVDVAIEEYKLEQEYQNFIQSLRDYLVQRKSQTKGISIVHDRSYSVFNAEGELLTIDELKTQIDHAFVCKHPMYIDLNLLAPLVSMAPEQIFLYTNDPFEGMIQTIQNIFQEKVNIRGLSEFETS